MPNQPSDSDVVLAIYSSQNMGQHKVVGARTGRVYGHFKGGDRFYVHKLDIAAQPHLFQPVQDEIPLPQESKPKETPEPTPIQGGTPPPSPQTHPIETVEEYESQEEVETPPDFSEVPISLEELPGISPQILQYLNAGGVHDIKQIKEIGVEGLVQIKGIGETRAQAILEFVNQYMETEGA